MEKKIINEGIKFQCQGSGNCCVSHGSQGYVYLSDKDLNNISKFFKITPKFFIKKYCEYTDGFLHFKEIRDDGQCQFLKNKKCTIYQARPTQCKTWPFWKENLNTKKWNTYIKSFCPGIGKGEIISSTKIKKIVEEDIKNSKNTFFKYC